MRPCIHDIFPGTIYSTGISVPSFIKHMKCVDSVFKFTTRQYLEPFLGPQKGMQMLTVITIFFFFGWLFSKSIFPVNTFKSEHIVNIEAILLLISFLADCPAGTKYDGLSKCLDCPLNSYQDRTAQSRCKPCPRNHVRDTLKSVTIYQCKG